MNQGHHELQASLDYLEENLSLKNKNKEEEGEREEEEEEEEEKEEEKEEKQFWNRAVRKFVGTYKKERVAYGILYPVST